MLLLTILLLIILAVLYILVVMLESGIFAVAKFSSVKPLTGTIVQYYATFSTNFEEKKIDAVVVLIVLFKFFVWTSTVYYKVPVFIKVYKSTLVFSNKIYDCFVGYSFLDHAELKTV